MLFTLKIDILDVWKWNIHCVHLVAVLANKWGFIGKELDPSLSVIVCTPLDPVLQKLFISFKPDLKWPRCSNYPNKLGLSLAKLSSNWNWNWVLRDFWFVALGWFTKSLLCTLAATNMYPPLRISSQNLVTSMSTYLHTSLLTCLLAYLLAYLLSYIHT